jgi:hypothetical protein
MISKRNKDKLKEMIADCMLAAMEHSSNEEIYEGSQNIFNEDLAASNKRLQSIQYKLTSFINDL